MFGMAMRDITSCGLDGDGIFVRGCVVVIRIVSRMALVVILSAAGLTGTGCGGGGKAAPDGGPSGVAGTTGGRGGAGGASGVAGAGGVGGATAGAGGATAGAGGTQTPADGGTPDAFTPHDAGRAPSGHALVPGGTKSASAGYVIVRTAGQSPGGNRVRSSASYKMVGGLVGATQK
jgi:hypothetical protein